MAADDETLLHWLSIENANDGIYVVDLRGKVLHVNRAFCAMLGYTREELERCNVRDWDSAFDPGQFHTNLIELTDQRTVVHTAYRRKDGSTLDVEVAVAASYVGGSAVVHCACREFTDKHRTEKALAESERRFSSLMHQSIAGIYIIQDGELVYVNPRFAGMFGYDTESEIMGRKVQDLVAGQWREQVIENMNRRLSGD